jgi:hypothetical protein
MKLRGRITENRQGQTLFISYNNHDKMLNTLSQTLVVVGKVIWMIFQFLHHYATTTTTTTKTKQKTKSRFLTSYC